MEKVAFDDFVDFIAGHYNHKGFTEYIERLMMHMGWVDIISGGEITSFVRPADRTVKLLELAGFTWPEPKTRVMTRLLEHGYAERLRFFSSCPIFAGMDQGTLLHLSKRARMRFTPDEGVLFHEKEGSDFMAILVDGAAEVSRLSVNGWAGTLFVVDEKTALGISNLHGSSHMPWTVEAYDDLLWYEVKHADIRPLMEKNPQLVMNIIDELNVELVKLSRFVVALN